MKTKLKLLMVATLLLAAFAGRSQCNAAFTATDNGVGNIQLQSTAYTSVDSVSGIQFIWDFGDGTSDTTLLPGVSHHYANSGTYNMCFTVTDPSHSCSVQQCDTHSVNLCHYASGFTQQLIGFGDYSFQSTADISGGSYTGTWDFFVGQGTATGLSATHQFTSDGLYNVCFNVAGPGCLDTTCQLDTVVMCQSFSPSFTYHVVSVNPYTAEFVATNPNPAYQYQWVLSDGSYAVNVDSAQFAISNNGLETMTISVFSNTYGCADSVKQTFNVDRCNMSPHTYENSNGTDANFGVYLSDSTLPGITNLWIFPGGTPPTSTDANVSVTYASLGTYTATVYVTSQSGCTDTIVDTFTLTPAPPPVYTIEGQISAGGAGGNATVYLIVQDTTGHLTLLDSVVIYMNDTLGTGTYYFTNLPVDTYYIKAALTFGNPDYANYLPTYYSSSLSWSTATPVDLSTGDAYGTDIALISGNNPGGPGFVGGFVSQGAGMVLNQNNNLYRSVGDPIGGVQINLVTEAGEAVAYTFTDANGYYHFNNLAYGSYKIYADQLNKLPVPLPFTLSSSDSSIADLNISINSDSAVATGINDVAEIAIQGVYPNPVINTLQVQLTSKLETNATFKLVDIMGRTTATNNTKLTVGNNKMEVNMENFAAGVYQLIIQTNSQQLSYKVVKAK